jgi:hypothetical protein
VGFLKNMKDAMGQAQDAAKAAGQWQQAPIRDTPSGPYPGIRDTHTQARKEPFEPSAGPPTAPAWRSVAISSSE